MYRTRRILTLLALIVVSFVAVHAQSTYSVVHANVPFKFSVGDARFPSGNYQFVCMGPGLVVLRNAKGQALGNVMTRIIEDGDGHPTSTKLRFYQRGKGYVLAQLWLENEPNGREVYKMEPAIPPAPSGQSIRFPDTLIFRPMPGTFQMIKTR